MSAKHMPGPWRLFRHGQGFDLLAADGCEVVANFDTEEANAALIAAAPELRDAIARILSRVSKHSAGYCVVDAADIDDARALLARLGVTL